MTKPRSCTKEIQELEKHTEIETTSRYKSTDLWVVYPRGANMVPIISQETNLAPFKVISQINFASKSISETGH